MLVPALSLASAQRILDMSRVHEPVYAAVGIHPTEGANLPGSWADDLERLSANAKVVAIGEIGLDYYWVGDPEARRHQREVLCAQLDLATKRSLPVILHMREEHDSESGACSVDMLKILRDWAGEPGSRKALAGRTGVMHSFSGSAEMAEAVMDLGFLIGVTGPITFRTADARRALVARLPLERLLIETDSPFLAPEPHRGRRNEPAFVAHIADRIAQVQSRTPREVAEMTGANAARLFAWGETA